MSAQRHSLMLPNCGRIGISTGRNQAVDYGGDLLGRCSRHFNCQNRHQSVNSRKTVDGDTDSKAKFSVRIIRL